MITLYKGSESVRVWPVDARGWIADGWSHTKPSESAAVVAPVNLGNEKDDEGEESAKDGDQGLSGQDQIDPEESKPSESAAKAPRTPRSQRR